MGDSYDLLTNDIHWVDRRTPNHRLVPMYSMVRTQPAPVTSMSSWETTTHGLLANGDAVTNRAHQGSDWNWTIEKGEVDVLDPGYKRIAVRAGNLFQGIENEMEFQIPLGAWNNNMHSPKDWFRHDHNDYGWLLQAIKNSDSLQALGEFWPTQDCGLFGIDDDDESKKDVLSFPSTSCGGQKFDDTWRNHYGRGIFFPLVSGRGDANMSTLRGFRGVPDVFTIATVPLVVEDWTTRNIPHRLGFLGDPIVDCGHEEHRVEIHPPHVITYETECDGPANGTCKGLTVVAFGWANTVSPDSMEFDVWPPPRPSASSDFVAKGDRTRLAAPSTDFGYVIDAAAPKAGPRATSADQPTLRCWAAPVAHPNHLHCTYKDPAAGKGSVSQDDLTHDNPRMLPNWATSRFEARLYVGWGG
jgi:hypothetical protein